MLAADVYVRPPIYKNQSHGVDDKPSAFRSSPGCFTRLPYDQEGLSEILLTARAVRLTEIKSDIQFLDYDHAMSKQPTSEDIARLFGPVSDGTIVQVLGTGANYAELEEVALYLAAADDVLGKLRRPLTGAAAQVYEILSRSDDFPEIDRER